MERYILSCFMGIAMLAIGIRSLVCVQKRCTQFQISNTGVIISGVFSTLSAIATFFCTIAGDDYVSQYVWIFIILVWVDFICCYFFWIHLWKLKNCRQQIVAKYNGFLVKKVHSRAGQSYTYYVPVFSYQWNGQEYDEIGCEERLTEKEIVEYIEGKEYQIYLNPMYPTYISLYGKVDGANKTLWFFVVLTGVLMFLGLIKVCFLTSYN